VECAVCRRGKLGIQQFDALHSEAEQFCSFYLLTLQNSDGISDKTGDLSDDRRIYRQGTTLVPCCAGKASSSVAATR